MSHFPQFNFPSSSPISSVSFNAPGSNWSVLSAPSAFNMMPPLPPLSFSTPSPSFNFPIPVTSHFGPSPASLAPRFSLPSSSFQPNPSYTNIFSSRAPITSPSSLAPVPSASSLGLSSSHLDRFLPRHTSYSSNAILHPSFSSPTPAKPISAPQHYRDWNHSCTLDPWNLSATARVGQSTFDRSKPTRSADAYNFFPYSFKKVKAKQPLLDEPIGWDFERYFKHPITIAIMQGYDNLIGGTISPYSNRPSYSASEKFAFQCIKQLQAIRYISRISIKTLAVSRPTQAISPYSLAYLEQSFTCHKDASGKETLVIDLAKCNLFRAAPNSANLPNRYLVIEMSKNPPIILQQRLASTSSEASPVPNYRQSLPGLQGIMLPPSRGAGAPESPEVEHQTQALDSIENLRDNASTISHSTFELGSASSESSRGIVRRNIPPSYSEPSLKNQPLFLRRISMRFINWGQTIQTFLQRIYQSLMGIFRR